MRRSVSPVTEAFFWSSNLWLGECWGSMWRPWSQKWCVRYRTPQEVEGGGTTVNVNAQRVWPVAPCLHKCVIILSDDIQKQYICSSANDGNVDIKQHSVTLVVWHNKDKHISEWDFRLWRHRKCLNAQDCLTALWLPVKYYAALLLRMTLLWLWLYQDHFTTTCM